MSIDSVQLNFNQGSLWVLNVCLAIIMFGIALEITVADFKRVVQSPRPATVGLLSQFILMPALTFLLVLIIRPAPSIALGMMMVAACPGGNISNFMTHLARGNTALSVSLTAMGTVLAIVLTPINLELWAGLYAPTSTLLKQVSLDVVDVFKTILLIVGIPLVLGMWVRRTREQLAAKISKIAKPLSVIIFAMFVFVAFANNFQNFIDHIHWVIWIVLIHNGAALTLGYFFSRINGLDERDSKTIAIETGIQNSGLGLLLIFSFFNGLGGMAIVAAWWGIWHIISGLSLAYYWSLSGMRAASSK